jgi:hypothetical protein
MMMPVHVFLSQRFADRVIDYDGRNKAKAEGTANAFSA